MIAIAVVRGSDSRPDSATTIAAVAIWSGLIHCETQFPSFRVATAQHMVCFCRNTPEPCASSRSNMVYGRIILRDERRGRGGSSDVSFRSAPPHGKDVWGADGLVPERVRKTTLPGFDSPCLHHPLRSLISPFP
jgi:hypothetical protein